jgi:KipI family sensor histidine kinase inhibitor
MDAVAEHLRKTLVQQLDSSDGAHRRTVIIPVRYDGPDLDVIAADLGLSREGVVTAHSSARHRVGFFGFAPGFPYIEGLPEQLRLPRLPTPRTRVGPGLIAIAGRHTCVYPGGTPGGWHLIGTTTEVLWDVTAQPPNRLSVGDHVVFEVVS